MLQCGVGGGEKRCKMSSKKRLFSASPGWTTAIIWGTIIKGEEENYCSCLWCFFFTKIQPTVTSWVYSLGFCVTILLGLSRPCRTAGNSHPWCAWGIGNAVRSVAANRNSLGFKPLEWLCCLHLSWTETCLMERARYLWRLICCL